MDLFSPIVVGCDNGSLRIEKHGADRDVTMFQSCPRFLQRDGHGFNEVEVSHGIYTMTSLEGSHSLA